MNTAHVQEHTVPDIVAEPRNTGVTQETTQSECHMLRLRKVSGESPAVGGVTGKGLLAPRTWKKGKR